MQLPFTPLPPLAPVTPPHARGCGGFACALSRALPGGGRIVRIHIYILYTISFYCVLPLRPLPGGTGYAPGGLRPLEGAPLGAPLMGAYYSYLLPVRPLPGGTGYAPGGFAPLRVLHSVPPSWGLTAPIFANGNSLIIFPGDYNRPGNNQLFPIFAKK